MFSAAFSQKLSRTLSRSRLCSFPHLPHPLAFHRALLYKEINNHCFDLFIYLLLCALSTVRDNLINYTAWCQNFFQVMIKYFMLHLWAYLSNWKPPVRCEENRKIGIIGHICCKYYHEVIFSSGSIIWLQCTCSLLGNWILGNMNWECFSWNVKFIYFVK